MVRNSSRPCRTYTAFLANRIILLSSSQILLSPLHWSPLTPEQESALQPAAPSSPIWTAQRGCTHLHADVTNICVYHIIELCNRKQNQKTPDRSQRGYGPPCLKATPTNTVKFLSSTVIITNEGNTWRPNSRETFRRVISGKLSMSVAILNASWASLRMCDEEWIFFWMDSNTVSSLRTSPARHKHCHQNGTSSQNIQRCIIIEPAVAMQ